MMGGSTVEQANWERDCVAYMRDLTNNCNGCMRRYNCPNCQIQTAKNLLQRKEQMGMRHRNLIDKPRDPFSLKARGSYAARGEAQNHRRGIHPRI